MHNLLRDQGLSEIINLLTSKQHIHVDDGPSLTLNSLLYYYICIVAYLIIKSM